jgi:dCMP deaminase
MRPCFGCTKEMLQAGVREVYYLHDWTHLDPEKRAEYERLQARFPGGIRKLDVEDPRASWAVTTLRDIPPPTADETGHTPS